jgi:hypothetical protein
MWDIRQAEAVHLAAAKKPLQRNGRFPSSVCGRTTSECRLSTHDTFLVGAAGEQEENALERPLVDRRRN